MDENNGNNDDEGDGNSEEEEEKEEEGIVNEDGDVNGGGVGDDNDEVDEWEKEEVDNEGDVGESNGWGVVDEVSNDISVVVWMFDEVDVEYEVEDLIVVVDDCGVLEVEFGDGEEEDRGKIGVDIVVVVVVFGIRNVVNEKDLVVDVKK